MRTTNISPEFIYTNVNGTLSMIEKKSFLGSKLIKFDDNISIISENIIYYQTNTNEQLNLDVEKLLPPIIYNTVNDKLTNSTIMIDDSETIDEYNNNTKWVLKIDMKTILINYIYATLKNIEHLKVLKIV